LGQLKGMLVERYNRYSRSGDQNDAAVPAFMQPNAAAATAADSRASPSNPSESVSSATPSRILVYQVRNVLSEPRSLRLIEENLVF
jgi:hypothetical protein